MKRYLTVLSLLLVCFVLLASGSNPRAFPQELDTVLLLSAGGMPPRPLPSRPIPHHDPGHPAKAANYATQVQRLNADGEEETVQLTGLDALMADGVMVDPLQSNYRLVDLDKLLWSSYHYWEGSNKLALQTFKLVTPTLTTVPGSWTIAGNHRFYDTAAGDLNGDLQDEQITAWIGYGNQIYLSIGEMPGSLGRVTSAPAVVSSTGALHLVVRGYDDALWHHDGTSWRNAGGRLLSGPAIASSAAGQLDVFAVGLDDSVEPNYLVVWHNQFWYEAWSGWEALDNPDEGNPPPGWPTVERDVPTPEFPAPVVVASGSNQLDLFWLWPDNTLRWRHFDGATWGSWQNLGGMLASGPGAVAHDGQIDVFARGVDDALWTRTYNGSWGENSHAWQRVDRAGMPGGVTIASAPAVVSPAAGRILVTVLGSDDRLWQLAYDGSSWGDWYPAGADKSTTPGRIGGALGLDGVDDYVDLPDNFPNVTGFTFAAWVYWNGGNAWQRIFDFGQDTNANMFLTPSNGTNMRFAITTGGAGAEKRLNASTPLAQNQWVHVAVTLDGSTGRLYMNGNVVDTQAITLTPQAVVGANTWLGKSQYAADPTFGGKIDEVAVFNRALSQPGIQSIYSSGWDSLSGKVLGLHLDESPATHGTTLPDVSGSGNDGKLYTFGNSKLAGAPAMIAHSGQIDLFARTTDGHLGHALFEGSTWTDWANFVGLSIGAVYNTGATTVTPPGNDALENLLLDVETGYFTGDGREQIVLAYQSAAGIRIEVYDVQNGFNPYKIAELAAPIAGAVPRITAADVDAGTVNGDGTDEIGIAHLVSDAYHYQVEIYNVILADGSGMGNLVKMPNASPRFYSCSGGCNDWDDDAHWFAGTLRITSGDFVKEAVDRAPNEEIAVLSDWGDTRDDGYDLWVQLYILDNDYVYGTPITECRPDTDSYCPIAGTFGEETTDDVIWDDGYATGVALGAGDVNGDGYDEIVLSWPYWFDGHDWPDLVRTLRVLNARNVNPIGATLAERRPTIMAEHFWIPGTPTYQRNSYLDTLAVGDLDRDLQDEIVFYQLDELQFYKYKGTSATSGTLELISRIPSMSGTNPKVNLVMGDFTGESPRVGPPTYRVQNRVDSVLARLTMPPKHWDMIKKDDGTYETIQIRTAECFATPLAEGCTRTLHGTTSNETSSTSIVTQRDWAIATGEEWKFSNTWLLEGSLETSYGENFSRAGEKISTTIFAEKTTAGYDDAVVYYRNPYKVWEYPVFSDNTTEPARYITVIFPDVTQSNAPSAVTGAACDGWYSPGHQPYNVWSYDPVGSLRFPDYDPDNQILMAEFSGTETNFEVYFINLTNVITTSSQRHSISREHGMGFEVSGSAGFNIGVASAQMNFENRFKAYTKSEYNWEDHVTDETKASNETSFGAHLAGTAPADLFTTRAIAYWSTAGPLVIDFQTGIGTSATWNKYDKPDPAFILPWYGYPDPAHLPYPDPNNQGRPPCGPEKQYFSNDVVIDPSFASVGQTVTISATVRNFSNKPITQTVTVRFYLGAPGDDNVLENCAIEPFDAIPQNSLWGTRRRECLPTANQVLELSLRLFRRACV